MAGGFLADRFSKRTITVGVKVFEIGVMSLVLVGLVWQQLPMLLFTVFLMGTHSAFFGPSKYGLLPELLPEKRLSWGNGLIELGTFMAIILGMQAAAQMSELFAGHQGWSGVVLLVLALAGLTASLGITRVPAANPTKKFQPNFLGDLIGRLRALRGRPAPGAGVCRQHLLQLPRHAPAVEPRLLRRGGAAREPSPNRLPRRGPGAGHRPGQPGGGLSVGRQDRIRPGAAGRPRDVHLSVPLYAKGLPYSGALAVAGAAGLFRRLLHRARFRPAPASARPRKRRARCWRRPTCCRSWALFLASGAHYLLAQVGCTCPRAASSCSAAC